MIGSRQLRLQIAARKKTAHMIAATARIALVGRTALASVYVMPVSSDPFLGRERVAVEPVRPGAGQRDERADDPEVHVGGRVDGPRPGSWRPP